MQDAAVANQWIVILEFTARDGRGPLGVDQVESLVARLSDWAPIGLYHPERFALQLQVPADSADQALRLAAIRSEAAGGPPSGDGLTRAEVVALDEFERTWVDRTAPVDARPTVSTDLSLVCTEVYDATRALLGAATPSEVAGIVTQCAVAMGGTVHIGPRRSGDSTTRIDLTISAESPLSATADRVSVAGMVMERWLPALVDDARQKLQLLEAG